MLKHLLRQTLLLGLEVQEAAILLGVQPHAGGFITSYATLMVQS